MTRDEVLALAREVGLWEMLEGYSSEYGSLDAKEDCLPTLERFAALVAEHERVAEREACAKVCDVMSTHPEYASGVTKLAAAAIRSRT